MNGVTENKATALLLPPPLKPFSSLFPFSDLLPSLQLFSHRFPNQLTPSPIQGGADGPNSPAVDLPPQNFSLISPKSNRPTMSIDHNQSPNNNDYLSSSPSSSSSSPKLDISESEELRRMPLAPVRKNKKYLSKQLSMRETRRDVPWEWRRRQIPSQGRRMSSVGDGGEDLTDEDLSELKGCIELGFGFNEEAGQRLCNTLPALDLYLAVNRQLSFSPSSSPFSRSQRNSSASLDTRSSSFGSLTASESDWKICNPGDDPQQVKTKLRHWAQAVACSVLQSI